MTIRMMATVAATHARSNATNRSPTAHGVGLACRTRAVIAISKTPPMSHPGTIAVASQKLPNTIITRCAHVTKALSDRAAGSCTAAPGRGSVQWLRSSVDTGQVSEPAAVVEIETRWTPPDSPVRRVLSTLARVGDALAMADNAGPVPTVPSGWDASWRVVVRIPATGVKVASSSWRTDWSEVEQLQRQWEAEVANLSDREVIKRANEWHAK